MSEALQEFVDSRGVAMRLDQTTSVIRGVKVLGLQSRNGRRYLPEALAQARALYEGAKVNVNHPKGHPASPRDYQDRLGALRNLTLRAGDGLFGDLHFNPKHPLAEQLLWDAEHAPENVGLSHNVEARTSRQGDETLVEAILKVQSVDLVADPATTRGLFEALESTAAELGQVTLEQLERLRPDLIETLKRESDRQLAQLREQIASLEVEQQRTRRQRQIDTLLAEHGLPTASDNASQEIVGRAFLETLFAAAGEPELRQLIQERAQLIAAARRRATTEQAPRSRDQHQVDAWQRESIDGRSFAASLR